MARPVGSTTRPQFYTYVDEYDRKEYVAWIKKNYKKERDLAKWFGDQIFGKAVQPIGNDDGKPLMVTFDPIFKNATTPAPEGDSKEQRTL